MTLSAVVKRDGQSVPFQRGRIAAAIAKAIAATGDPDPATADELALVVEDHIGRMVGASVGLEEIQDAVVHVLQESGHYLAALAYQRYRDERERSRRSRRALGDVRQAANLAVVWDDGRRRAWDRGWITLGLAERHGLSPKAAGDVVAEMEKDLAGTAATELPHTAFCALCETAMVRLGLANDLARTGDVRLDRRRIDEALTVGDGMRALIAAGRLALEPASLAALPETAHRLFSSGRLWIDGLNDPLRGCQLTFSADPAPNPYQVVANAFAATVEATAHWRRVRVILPPSILGHLERGATQLVPPLAALGRLALVHLYCDGRTPLLERWPFPGSKLGLATWSDDFLLQRRLQELGLPLISGPHLSKPGWRQAVPVELALNAQGLDGEFAQLDHLATAAVAAARLRLRQLGPAAAASGGDLRFAVTGLAATTESAAYLERQTEQEGLRVGLKVSRTNGLSNDACTHFGRLLG